jgi:hypothetical protein
MPILMPDVDIDWLVMPIYDDHESDNGDVIAVR